MQSQFGIVQLSNAIVARSLNGIGLHGVNPSNLGQLNGVAGSASGLLGLAGGIAGLYHGYHRNHNSTGWAIGWFIFGSALFPIAIPLMLIQGFAKPATSSFRKKNKKRKK